MADDRKAARMPGQTEPARCETQRAHSEDALGAPDPEDLRPPGKEAEVGLIDGVYPL